MVMKSIDFTQEVRGAEPVSPDGRLLANAAVTEAKGAAVKQGVTDNLVTAAGKAGLDAVKGYLESGLEKDIKKTIGSLETANRFGDAVTSFDVMANDPNTPPADLQKAQQEIQKYKAALDQGVMTREQALLAIDKSVKEYSNILPGYASNLRRLATEVTGVEHMGNYAEYALLTKQTQSEKIREQRLKNQMELEQKAYMGFTTKYGRPPVGGMQGNDMRMFQAEAALAAQAESLKTQANIRDATIAQTEPVVTQYINTRLASGILTLNTKLQGITGAVDPKTGKLQSPENRVLLREQILSEIGTTFESIKAELLGFNANQISNATREQQLSRLNTQQAQLTDALKNQDTFDAFSKTMGIQSLEAKNVWDKFVIAHPQAIIMKNSGMVTPDTVKLWIDSQQQPARAAEFRRLYGPGLDDYYRSFSNPNVSQTHISNAGKIGTDPNHLSTIKNVDPAQYAAQLHGLRDSITAVVRQGWGVTPEVAEVQKRNFPVWIQSFTNQVNSGALDLVREWTKLMADPAIARRVKELDPQAQLAAIEPIYNKSRELLENPQFGLLKRLSQLQAKSKESILGLTTTPFEVVLNPITKQFQVAQATTQRTRGSTSPADMTPKGAAGFQTFRPGSFAVSAGGASMAGEVKTIVDTINRSLSALNNFKDIKGVLPPDMAENGVNAEYFYLYTTDFFNKTPEEQQEALKTRAAKPDTDPKKLSARERKMQKEVADLPINTGTAEDLEAIEKALTRKDLTAKARKELEEDRERIKQDLNQPGTFNQGQ